jgi:hypothetical protein
MVNPENSALFNLWERFDGKTAYKEAERAPKTVVTQTDSIIELTNAGIVTPDVAYNYLSAYTVPFLKDAAQGAGRVYGHDLATIQSLPLELNEAADFANIVFGWMHYFAKSNYFPSGFSKNGALRAPENSGEFIKRLKEIKIQLGAVASGSKPSEIFRTFNGPALRTYTFFKVGSTMPLKFINEDRERKEYESSMIGKLFDGIDVNL